MAQKKFWLVTQFYGGDALLVRRACKEMGMQLVAVAGFQWMDYPDDREYVIGNTDYLVTVWADSISDAIQKIYHDLHERYRLLFLRKYPDVKDDLEREKLVNTFEPLHGNI